jgi:hypothetical protein
MVIKMVGLRIETIDTSTSDRGSVMVTSAMRMINRSAVSSQ